MRRISPVTALSVWRLGQRVRDKVFTTVAGRAFASCGPGSTIRLPFRVEGERAISLGARVFVGEGSWFQTLHDGVIEIGDGCRFSGYAVISAALAIVIEADVLVARNVHVLDHIHRFDLDGVPVHEQGISTPRPVLIGTGAWIGANVVVLPGVAIGRNAVVGANSIVHEDVPDGVVVAGAPARILRGNGQRRIARTYPQHHR